MSIWDRVFGRKTEQKRFDHTTITTTHDLVQFLYGNEHAWDTPNYKNYANLGYRTNAIVAMCVNEIAANTSQVKWLLYKDTKRGKERVEVEDPKNPINRLLKRPNPRTTFNRLVADLIADHYLDGNRYVVGVNREAILRGGTELWRVRPPLVDIQITEGLTYPEYYDVGEGKSRKRYWVNQDTGDCDVLHIHNYNPLNDYKGESPLKAAWYAIQVHNEQQRYSYHLLKNNARPGLALLGKDLELTDEQRAKLKEELRDTWQGAENAGRPAILEGHWDLEMFGMTPVETDFVEASREAARIICASLGVPPLVLGLPGDATYSNLREARRALFEQTISPELEKIKTEINNWLIPDGFQIDYDGESIPAMMPKRELAFGMYSSATFLTVNEKREAVGYSPIDGGDVLQTLPGQGDPNDAAKPDTSDQSDDARREAEPEPDEQDA